MNSDSTKVISELTTHLSAATDVPNSIVGAKHAFSGDGLFGPPTNHTVAVFDLPCTSIRVGRIAGPLASHFSA